MRRYLRKTTALADLVGAIRSLVTGRSAARRSAAGSHPDPRPTARQLDVLRLVVEGLGNRAIAERLAISERTVECHMTGLLTKFRARSRAELVRLALQQGWVA